MTPRRRRGLATTAMAVTVLACWLTGLLVRTVAVDVQFFGETADRSDYRVAAGAGVTTAALLLLGLLAVTALGAPRWLRYLTGAGLATQLALGVTAWWSSRDVEDTEVFRESAGDGVRDVLLLPTTWPLLAVLVVAVVVTVRRRRSE